MKLVLSILFFTQVMLHAQLLRKDDPTLSRIDIKENLGNKVPLNLDFFNEKGLKVSLSTAFQNKKPVVLTLAYYECPMLCTFVLNGLSNSARELEWIPGKDYELLTISIDPDETADLAVAKRSVYEASLNKTDAEFAWNFWVGDKNAIDELADAAGFKYFYDENRDEFAHPAVVFVLTEDGHISRYLYGIEYSVKDLRLAILEAAEGKIGTIIDRVILFCHYYDPAGKKYVLFAMNVMRLGGIITVLVLGVFVSLLWMKEKKRNYE